MKGFTYTGREYDENTGLYYYRARWYSASQARFISADPLGVKLDANLFYYVNNSPIRKSDPSGLAPWLFVADAAGTAADIAVVGADLLLLWRNPSRQALRALGLDVLGAVTPFVPSPGAVRWAAGAAKTTAKCLQAGAFGPISKRAILTYVQASKVTAGARGAIQAHHIVEARHLKSWTKPTGTGPAVVLTKSEHNLISGQLRTALEFGSPHSVDKVWAVYKKIYAKYPSLLEAARLYLGKKK